MSVEIKGTALPEHISYSSFTTWLECGFKYWLSRVEEQKELPAWWFVGGSAVHTATETFDRAYEREIANG